MAAARQTAAGLTVGRAGSGARGRAVVVLEESFESTDIKFEVEAFSHPAAPAAVATYTVVEDDIDFHCRDYAVGAAAGVLAYLCTDPDQPEDRIAESDEIVRTIRVE